MKRRVQERERSLSLSLLFSSVLSAVRSFGLDDTVIYNRRHWWTWSTNKRKGQQDQFVVFVVIRLREKFFVKHRYVFSVSDDQSDHCCSSDIVRCSSFKIEFFWRTSWVKTTYQSDWIDSSIQRLFLSSFNLVSTMFETNDLLFEIIVDLYLFLLFISSMCLWEFNESDY